ncbi:DUF342 domain-containing protein [Ketobacter sp. MCCC 1A13808]|uniref:hypothetical protein n=1 Tax=Ketobacter sp. MCCC 1A13808 TaxID=2602738 RepID=UPI000F1F6AEB|nr:hypothetical protein [Ketobacter sp. MCCC 1A13808]MVF13883.1 DUF342 domain-containing protein [Ketobacter sp. MCCC 1A13808]RLP54933.1 MAG: hypothetical protein D6160_08980 [Ketobacter sp.]
MPFKQSVNFYQDSFRKPVVKLPLNKILLAWAGVFCLLAVVSALDLARTSQARATLKKMESSQAKLEAAVAKLQQQADAISLDERLVQQEKMMRKTLQNKRQFIQALKQQGEMSDLKFSGYLQALSTIDAGPVWLTLINIHAPGPEISLYGLTNKPKAIPRYVNQLKSDSSFVGMRFKVFNLERDKSNSNYLTFNLSTRFDDNTAQ